MPSFSTLAGIGKSASTHARKALDAGEMKHSGLRYHPTVGLVHSQR